MQNFESRIKNMRLSARVGIVLEVRGFTHHCFSTARLNDCSTVVKLNLLSESQALLLHDGCAIHDTREGVSLPIRLYRGLVMCDVYRIVNGRLLWVGRMCEADAMARVCRHRGETFLADIPF